MLQKEKEKKEKRKSGECLQEEFMRSINMFILKKKYRVNIKEHTAYMV